jgi:hypothetical protein
MSSTSGASVHSTRSRSGPGTLILLTAVVPALLLVQVYVAGLFVMGGIDTVDAHRGLGWAVLIYPIVLAPFAYRGGASAQFWITLAIFWVAAIFQAFLPRLSPGDASGWFRSLHAVAGVVLVGFGLRLVRAAKQPD